MTSRISSLVCALGLLGGGCGGTDPNGSGGGTSDGSTGATGADASATQGGMSAEDDDDSGQASGGVGDTTGAPDSAGDSGGPDPGIDLECGGFGTPDADPPGVVCFFDIDNPDLEPAANLQYALVDLDGTPAIYLQLIFAPWFADNTYGANTIGWPNDKHTFKDLVGSDHAVIEMRNKAGDLVLGFELDYITENADADSGYRCEGIWGGEGKMDTGDPAAILAANSSLSRNLNERGHAEYTTDSPATDDSYTPNPAAPDWDFRVVYEVWVDASLFADEGDDALQQACVQFIHASPSKIGDNSKDVFPDECPPGWGCYKEGGCDECTPDSSDPDSSSTCDPGDGFPDIP